MRIHTRDMGIVEVTPGQVLDFVGPVFGFESRRHYALLPVPNAAPFHWLQSIEDRALALPVVAAEELSVQYPADAETLKRLSATASQLRYWVVVTLPSEDSPITVNLRAPLAVNTVRRQAAQVIMRETYAVRCTLESCRTLEAVTA